MKKPKKISKEVKKQIFKKIKENIDKKKQELTKKEFFKNIKKFGKEIESKRSGWKKEEQNNIKDKKQEKQQESEELENLIEKTSTASASSFNLENFRNLALEEIIPVLKERGFQQTGPRIRNIQIGGEKEDQEERIYDIPKTLAVSQKPSENYRENSDYLSSMNKNYEIKQITPDGSSGKFVTSMQDQSNRFQTSDSMSSGSQTSSSSIGTTQIAQSYETEQERKLIENRRRF